MMRHLSLGSLAVSVALVALTMTGCSKSDGPSIIGHWRAERVQVLSAHLPIGPDFVVSQHELASPDAEVQIPIAGIESKRNEAIVDFAYGVGLSFYFDGPDRMYVQVPLAGKLYYRRVKDEAGSGVVAHLVIPSRTADAPAVVSHPPGVPVKTNSSDQAQVPRESEKAEPPYKIAIKQGELSMARGNLEAAGTYFASASADQDAHPMIDYDLALLKLRQGDQDAAIRHLGDAFAKGFRGFDVIAQDASFDPIKSDIRFTALVSRYR